MIPASHPARRDAAFERAPSPVTPVRLALALILAALGALAVGPARLGALDLPTLLALRGPRVLLAAITGAALSLTGVLMQAFLRNDLADPYILGISGGAAAGAVSSMALWPGMPPGMAAAAGAAGAVGLVRGLAGGLRDPARLLLAGVAVSSVLGSLTGLVLVLAPASQLIRSATFWLFGGLGTPALTELALPGGLLAGGLLWSLARAERLDRWTLGDDAAVALGVDVARLRRCALLTAVALTAATVSSAGLIGFVGLVAPHCARRVVGARHRALLPAAALGGALLLVIADTLARTAFAPREVPVGLVTACLGGPFFLRQLRRGIG